MIEPTDAMEEAFDAAAYPLGLSKPDVKLGLAAAITLAERQFQEQYGDAFQAGYHRGQYELCPRCGVELDREVAEERAGRPTPELIAARPKPARRLRACVENWPDAIDGEHDPHCCRWLKSCSCTVYDEDTVNEADLESEREA